jgi:hypothetical protein
MTSEERAALANAEDIVAIANALAGIKGHNRRRTAAGLLTVAETLLTGDVVGRIALACLMSEAITELLRGVSSEELPDSIRWWN